MKFKALLFDLDGTVLDTSDLIMASFRHTLKTHYNREPMPAEIYPFFGRPLKDAMDYFDSANIDCLLNTYRAHNSLHHDEMIKVFEGVADTLQILFAKGISLAVVTSKTQATAIRGLKLFNLDKFFPVIIGHEQCEQHKPNPEPVITAVRELKLQSAECLMIGDTSHDIISGKKAGTSTAAVKWSCVDWSGILEAQPDYILTKFDDILKII